MHHKDAGFTLVEMLVSLFVIAMLASAGGMLLLQTLRASAQVDARVADVADMQTAHALMSDDFLNMRSRIPVSPDPFVQDAGFLGRSGDRDGTVLRFVRGGWINPAGREVRGDLQYVEYHLEEGALRRIAYLRPDPDEETPYVKRDLATGIQQMDVRYSNGSEWLDSWLTPTGAPREGRPRAVEMTLMFSETDTLTQVFLTGVQS